MASACLAAAIVAGLWLWPRAAAWMTPRPSGALRAPDTAVSPAPDVEGIRPTERRRLPFATEVVYSDDLPVGRRIVERRGEAGLARIVYGVRTSPDGVAPVEALRRHVIRPPIDRLVVVGTAPVSAAEGLASWYDRDGRVAAHPTLPIGTRVTVTSVASGRSVTVIIDDRGPFIAGRIIDLSDDAFARIAPLSAGTAHVRLSW